MAGFQTTRWSLIVASRDPAPDAREALEQLCRAYRPAVFSYLRSRGYPRDAAEDHTQGFFTRFLERRIHEVADPARGRFRVLVRTALDHYLADAREHERAAKRGSGQGTAELNEEIASGGAADSPEHQFELAWALTVLDRAMVALGAEARASGKFDLFERVREFLTEAPDPDDYARVGAELGMRPNTLAVAVHRLRGRMRELVRIELAETVADPSDVGEELRALRGVLGGPGA
jgi:RNA polymerase sigma-70 factor (ECF subfamily)